MRWLSVLPVWFVLVSPCLAQKEYGFDNRKPSGQPYLAPQETVQRMKVHPGFSVKLFAAEPMMTNPIAMTIDDKGRVWIIESFEYPKRTPKGKAPRDRIVILEDTDGDGIADKRTVFAEGKDFPVTRERAEKGLGAFDMASGLEVGQGGCYVGAPPYLWHLKDTKGTGKADSFEIVASGFGSQDTHETLNTFTWGPDGWLYGLHGVFTISKVKSRPDAIEAGDNPIDLDAGVWRYHPRTRKFEIFAEGTSNPWGMDFNKQGECFLCCCVIPHLFHIVPGGIYIKQGSKPSYNQYAYGALKEICDHTFHKESGWAHAGLLCLDAPHIPHELQNSVIFGSIHGCSIKRNILKPHGSTFIGSRADDFLVSGDKNFRPIQMRWAPDGSILVSDWHDQNPCHQTNPDDWDYERGRIYRIVPTSPASPTRNENNPFWRKVAWQQRLEQPGANNVPADIRRLPLDSDQVQAEAISQSISPVTLREHASALIQLAGKREIMLSLNALCKHSLVQNDTVIPYLLWLATERELSVHHAAVLKYLLSSSAGNEVILHHLLARSIRRLAASGKPDELHAALMFIRDCRDITACRAALSGLSEAMKGRKVKDDAAWNEVKARLNATNDPEITRSLRSLASSFYDSSAVAHHLAVLSNDTSDPRDQIAAIQELAFQQVEEALPGIVRLLHHQSDGVKLAAARSLAAYDKPVLADELIKAWKQFPQPVRAELVNTLRSRKPWAKTLLVALGAKTIARSDLNDNVALAIRQFKDKELNTLLDKHYGAFRDSPAEIEALLTKLRKEVPASPGNAELGKAVFAKHCLPCHKFEGNGHDVGPNLDGAERSMEYLLVNIVDPNRVVGTPYFSRTVVLKNGKLITGILVEEDATTLRLKRDNAVIEVIVKADIEEQNTSTKSLMPEGLSNNMTLQELRDLIRYLQPAARK